MRKRLPFTRLDRFDPLFSLWASGFRPRGSQDGCTSIVNPLQSFCGSYFNGGVGGPYIFIAHDSAISGDTVVHETGHHYMWNATGWWLCWDVGCYAHSSANEGFDPRFGQMVSSDWVPMELSREGGKVFAPSLGTLFPTATPWLTAFSNPTSPPPVRTSTPTQLPYPFTSPISTPPPAAYP